MRIGYLECFSGISGDMFLGALVDAGVPFNTLAETAAALNVGARLEMRKVTRGGITATKVDVISAETPDPAHSHFSEHAHTLGNHTHERSHHDDEGEHAHTHSDEHRHHRSLSTILDIIHTAPLSEFVKQHAGRAFQLLGEAEAAIHSIPIDEVHFHEVGAVDTIVDIACAAAGCEALAVHRWLASPLNVGSGTVECAHGTLPVPAPATLKLLGNAPVYSSGQPMERVTPTGAVILRMLDVQYEPLPPIRVAASGYGAGGRETPGQPNLIRLLIGEEAVSHDVSIEPIAIIETVIDDSTPQLLAYVSDLLLEAGAWDVYRVAVQMKKGRSGVQLTVLCNPELVSSLRNLILRETTTIGLHWRIENKASLDREFVEAHTAWGPVRIKVARWPTGETANAAPEYEDCRAIARKHSIPLKQVMQAAVRAYISGHVPGHTKQEAH
jgi:uncharacterized protein (TIGR00299 family) protein